MACEDLQTRYDTLRVAYDKWLTTGGQVTVRYGEKQVGYGPMDGKALKTELMLAKDALDACNGVRGARRRILRVIPIG